MRYVLICLPKPTHNPWHPAYRLVPEGQHRVSKEIAGELLREQLAIDPTSAVCIIIGGVLYAGHAPK